MNFILPSNKLTLYIIIRYMKSIDNGTLFLSILLTTRKAPILMSQDLDSIKKQVLALTDEQIAHIFEHPIIQNITKVISDSLMHTFQKNPVKMREFMKILEEASLEKALKQIDEIQHEDEKALQKIRESINK